MSYKAFSDTDSRLALAGGGALNKQGVDKIRHNWESVHVIPESRRSWSCIGAVLAHTKTKIVHLTKHGIRKYNIRMSRQNTDYGYDIQKVYSEMFPTDAESFVRCRGCI